MCLVSLPYVLWYYCMRQMTKKKKKKRRTSAQSRARYRSVVRVRPRCFLVVRKLRETTPSAGCVVHISPEGEIELNLVVCTFFLAQDFLFFCFVFSVWKWGPSNEIEAICVIEQYVFFSSVFGLFFSAV